MPSLRQLGLARVDVECAANVVQGATFGLFSVSAGTKLQALQMSLLQRLMSVSKSLRSWWRSLNWLTFSLIRSLRHSELRLKPSSSILSRVRLKQQSGSQRIGCFACP